MHYTQMALSISLSSSLVVLNAKSISTVYNHAAMQVNFDHLYIIHIYDTHNYVCTYLCSYMHTLRTIHACISRLHAYMHMQAFVASIYIHAVHAN